MIAFGCPASRPVWVCGKGVDSVEVCVIAPLHLLILGKCYAVCPHKRIVTIHYNESVHRKKQHTGGHNTIPFKLASLVTFESLK